jgi:DNA topoisomerase VI subunit B
MDCATCSKSQTSPFLQKKTKPSQILAYLRQIAVITPYAQFSFSFVSEDPKASLALRFARRTDAMPPMPVEVKHHPASVDLELVKRLLADSPAPTMAAFLAREFSCISKAHASRLASEVRAGVSPDTPPASLDAKQAVRLHQLLHEARFPDPPGDHLSPAGEYNLRLGIAKELCPDLVATHQGEARALEGHAFIVEAAVSLGGSGIKPGLNIYRFANRIPLLFEGGSDVITKTALKRINWAAYKINQATDRVGVFVSVVSTRIPYKGAGKEYISDDMDGMVAAVRAALQACCAQLKVKIARAQAAREQRQRRKNLTKYIPAAANAVYGVLAAMADRPGGPKRRRLEAGAPALLPGIAAGVTTADTLAARLNEYVERVDTDLALEYQMQQVRIFVLFVGADGRGWGRRGMGAHARFVSPSLKNARTTNKHRAWPAARRVWKPTSSPPRRRPGTGRRWPRPRARCA